jgi:hypothetical protein
MRMAGVPAVFEVDDVIVPLLLPLLGVEVVVDEPKGNGQPDPDRDVKNGTRPVRVRLELEDRGRLVLFEELDELTVIVEVLPDWPETG